MLRVSISVVDREAPEMTPGIKSKRINQQPIRKVLILLLRPSLCCQNLQLHFYCKPASAIKREILHYVVFILTNLADE